MIRRPSALNDERMAREGGETHRESDGGGRGVWKGSEASRRRRPRTGEREREGAVEVESDENETKTVKWRYLRLRWVAVELLGTSALSFALGRRG